MVKNTDCIFEEIFIFEEKGRNCFFFIKFFYEKICFTPKKVKIRKQFLKYVVNKLMMIIENDLKVALQVYALDKNNKIYNKGVVYPNNTLTFDGSNYVLLRFLHKNSKMGDYAIKSCTDRVIVGQTLAKNQILNSAYFIWIDMPEIRLHNLTGCDLHFNGHLTVPARDSITYTGRNQDGIQTGFLLVNNDGIFRDFLVKHKITDIYFGIISNRRLPVYTQNYLRW